MENAIVTRSASRKSAASEGPSPDASQKRKLDPAESPDQSSKRVKSASQAFARHSRFWALDGNVILQFGSVAFKVHRSRLATQSVWFEKLFERRAGREEPLEEDEENIKDVGAEEVEGCDVFQLEALGNMSDFEALLTAMEDSIQFYYDPPRFLTAAAIFRAATTFKFLNYLEFTRQYLLDLFSEDLEDLTTTVFANPTDAIVLGRTWNLPGILKRAFYELLRAQPAAPSDADADEGAVPKDVVHRLRGLDLDDLIRLSDTQKFLTAAWLSVLSPAAEKDKCPAKTPCGATRLTGGWSAIVGKDMLLQKFQYDPICGLNFLIEVQWATKHSFCDHCAAARKIALMKKRKEIWMDLDEWLDIPVDEEEEDKSD
ncbi:hypothetical protein DFH07DRAFT_841914 [Mycena maculata]|uniref:BTB domain-containing protein n=1 Tax=Mycena maculata TaxID=230809 RepID=A0AAD7I9K7_9AGAR|nr:hypothetical protein DFH07DRAFT_841914 [Mycena maculata]